MTLEEYNKAFNVASVAILLENNFCIPQTKRSRIGLKRHEVLK